MSSFTTPLLYKRLRPIGSGRLRYRLREPFTYALQRKDGPVTITVPKGFVTDLASIPRRIDDWFGLNPSGRLAKAAVLHDALYASRERIRNLAWTILHHRAQLGEDYVRSLTGPLPLAVDDLRILVDDRRFLRRLADRIFFEALGVPPRSGWDARLHQVIRCLSYLAVRLFAASKFQPSTASSRETHHG